MAERKSAKHRKFERAIADMYRAYESLGALIALIPEEDVRGDDGRVRLRADLNEYASYLDAVSWWRDKEKANG